MNWRKSARSYANGNCVEVGEGDWRKASFSESGNCVQVGEGDWRKSSLSHVNGNCVEAATGTRAVLVRDTADQDGPVLAFPARAWARFLEGIG